jgi:membrane-bound ClpP family serine protease
MRSPDNREPPERRGTAIALVLLWAFLLFTVYVTYQASAVLALLLAALITQFWPILHELVTDLPRMIAPARPGTSHPQHGSDPRGSAALVNRTDVAATLLCPSGYVEIDGIRYDAVAEGGYLEAGTAVRVMDVKQGSLVVRTHLPSSS